MKQTHSLLVIGLLSTLSISALAQNRPYYDIDNDRRSRDEIRHQFRDSNIRNNLRDYSKNADVCQDVKENLVMAQNSYNTANENYSHASSQVSSARSARDNKSYTLNRLENTLSSAKSELATAQDYSNRKLDLVNEHSVIVRNSTKDLNKNKSLLVRQEDKKEKDCGFWGSLGKKCRAIKKQISQTKSTISNLKATISKSESMLDYLSDIEATVVQLAKNKNKAQANLTRERAKTPSLSQLESKLAQARNIQADQVPALDNAKIVYGQTAIRSEKCSIMKFEARKSRVFRNAILDFARDNGEGCKTAKEKLRRVRGHAAKEALREAYDLVCDSKTLVRYVEVQAQDPQGSGGDSNSRDERRGNRGNE